MTAGDIYTVAGSGLFGFAGDGGAATGAQLSQPGAVAVDPAGDILVADTASNQIREIGA
jgi:DNA-binding beta-propeller fold protein YncE